MLTPIQTLVPNVEEIQGERLVFRVRSRSVQNKRHRVDMEAKHGLGTCWCWDCRGNKNPDCYHLQSVRKYIAVKVVQAVLTSQNEPPKFGQQNKTT
jgi:hypothetical protein